MYVQILVTSVYCMKEFHQPHTPSDLQTFQNVDLG